MSTVADPLALGLTSRLRLLLIEDSESDSELVKALLEDELPNAEVDAAMTLELALDRLAEASYDLVLADLTLPDAEGGTVVRAVRDAYPDVALMVLTGRVDGSMALWALAAGAQDYLVKGQHDGPHLAEEVLYALQRSRAERATHALLLAAISAQSQSAEELRELDDARTDFVASVTHEFRTPLTSISAYAELLQEATDLSPGNRSSVEAIVRNTARLRLLTDDLLLVSGLASWEQPTASDRVDLRDVVDRACEVISPVAAGSHIALERGVADEPLLVTGDAERLEHVVLNLLSNAVKFSTEAGAVTCLLSGSPTEVILSVGDTGIGMLPEETEQVFTRFFRGAGARENVIPGTGLGLHIAASIVKGHDGQISAESELGHGTTMTVRLPRRVCA